MPDPRYPPGNDPADLDNTQPTQPATTPMPPTRDSGSHALPSKRRKDGKRKNDERATTFYPGNQNRPKPPRGHRRDRSESGLYLPAWSVILMLVIVLSVAGGIILLVITLGGNPAAPGKPRVIIVTALPSATAPSVAAADVTLAAAQSADPGALQLAGPLLPTVAISPTPVEIAVGRTVRVVNVADHGLNVRQGPGTDKTSNFVAHEGDTFVVTDGPQTSENFTWWQLQSNTDPAKAGWAVENDGEQDTLEVAVQ